MSNNNRWLLVFLLILGFIFASIPAITVQAAPNVTVYAVTEGPGQNLLTFDVSTPGTVTTIGPITGLIGAEEIIGIDFRPGTTELYAVSDANRLYEINPATAAVTQVGADGVFTLNAGAISLGMDFNPTVDRVRLVNDTDDNLRLNPNNGALSGLDTNLAYAAGDLNVGQNPHISAAAYNNNIAATPTTTLYGIDIALDILVIQNPPNGGVLTTVGSLTVDTTYQANFDITTPSLGSDIAYAILQTGSAQLYTINLGTGAATLVGTVGAGTPIIGMAIETNNVPPNAVDDTANFGNSGTAVSINVLGNDVDPDGSGFAITAVTNGASGTVAITGGGSGLTYQPNAGFTGTDTFTYTITDADGLTDTATVTVNVSAAAGKQLFGVTPGNLLVTFLSTSPQNVGEIGVITGLQPGETIIGIDFRPADGQLYGLGSTNRLYFINRDTGAASQVGSGTLGTPLAGSSFGFDFNPTVDRIRVVSDTGQNMRLNPTTGTTAAVDVNLNYAVGDVNQAAIPNVVAGGYNNNFAGTTLTVLYDIDTNLDILAIQNPPNGGTLNTIGALGVNATAAHFDITGDNVALAALSVGGQFRLFLINLATGGAVDLGTIGNGTNYVLQGFAAREAPGVVTTPGTAVSAAAQTFANSDFISKAVDKSLAQVGSTLTYTISFGNPKGTPLNSVVISDTFDSRLSNVWVVSSSLGTATVSGNTVTVQGFSLLPGQRVSLVVTATISNRASAGDTILNSATLNSPDASIHVSNTVETLIAPGALPGTGETPYWRTPLLLGLMLLLMLMGAAVLKRKTGFATK